MSRLPIRLRVTAAFALALALVLAASGWYLHSSLGEHLDLALNRGLEQRSQDLAALVEQPNASLRADKGGAFIEPGESYAQLLDLRGRMLDATRPLTRSLLTPAELRRAHLKPTFANRASVPGLDEPSRLLASPVAREGRQLVLVVGATRQDRAETLSSFRNELLIAGPIALVLASLAGYFLAGLSLRQVDAMRRRAATISAERAGERLPVPATGDELERLGETLNAMLDRLEGALARQRDFVADAGHELRTPLALLRTELELALRHPGSEDELQAAVRRSAEEVDRLSRLAEDLLLLARSDGGGVPLRVEKVAVADLVATVQSRFQWRADDAARTLATEVEPGIQLRGDRLRLEQALANLVDNGLRHGRGPVCIIGSTVDGNVELHVTDAGAGFQPGFLEHAFERFTRPHAGREGSGAGLGLAIVQAIATAHGGTAHAANVEGGADVWLALPP